MDKRGTLIALLWLTLIACLATTASAQRNTASIRGTVTSSDTGAVLPGATVTLRNVDTGLTREVATNAEGNYTFGNLPTGSYEVTVEFPDFKTTVVKDVVLRVADVREVSTPLEIGQIEEEITVNAPSLVVETIGGEVATTVTGEEVRELPLNGRNFTQLTQLVPGVSASDSIDFKNKGLLSGVDTSVSGSSATGNQWVVDGANNNDTGSNRTILVYPSVEAIEEFKIHRNSYGPEFGGAGGAQINLVTRGGTNEYKGSVFAFHRNDAFNEPNEFLDRIDADTEELERTDVGFTLGGPIVRDKVQFFVSTEWNDETRGTVRSAQVPTLAERSGDFSQSVPGCNGPTPIDPITGLPFPGNVIPNDRLSPGGLELLRLYPTPNLVATPGNCNNWVASVPTDIDFQQINARVDYQVTESARALVRYTQDEWENPAPNAGAGNGLWGDDPFPAVDSGWDQPGESLVAQINNVFSDTIVNTFTFSRSGNEISIGRGDDELNSSINNLIPSTFPEAGKLNAGNRAHPVYWGGATGD
ncbi:MAG: carboxypeptidase regulatory-like domain-containing protein, partial [Acidobacteriota bacterium]